MRLPGRRAWGPAGSERRRLGRPVAALALDDGRAIADPFVPTDHLVATPRIRAKGVRASARGPALRERLRDAIPRVARGRA